MNGLLFLIPLAVAMGFAWLITFLWALRSHQYEDLDGAAGRILFDDDPPETASSGGSQSPSSHSARRIDP